jgi:hypothetical protein
MTNDDTLPLYMFLGLFALVWSAGCGGDQKKKGPPPKQDFKIEVEVTDERNEAVPEAPVNIDGKTIGYTDRNGELVATIRDRPGTKIELEIGDMEGYRFVSDQKKTEKLKLRKSVTGKGYQPVGIPFSAKVTSTTQPYLIWVRALCDDETMESTDCKGLPIKRDGQIVARTDQTGRAHFSLDEEPQTKTTIMIDTPESQESEDGDDDEGKIPTFKPAHPTFDISFSHEPKVYLIEQKFEDPTAEETGWQPPPGYDPGGSDDDSDDSGGGSGGGGGASSSSGGGDSGGSDSSGGSGSEGEKGSEDEGTTTIKLF